VVANDFELLIGRICESFMIRFGQVTMKRFACDPVFFVSCRFILHTFVDNRMWS
jgi:hypothetical protein